MKATEARELAQTNLQGPVIEPLMKAIHDRIIAAAKEGKFSIINPFSGTRSVYPSHEQQQAVWQALATEGYKVTHHPDPDPGDPRGGAYTEVSWK